VLHDERNPGEELRARTNIDLPAHPEYASGLTVGPPPPEGFDDVLAQVFRIGVHAYIVPSGPSTLQTALVGQSQNGAPEALTLALGGYFAGQTRSPTDNVITSLRCRLFSQRRVRLVLQTRNIHLAGRVDRGGKRTGRVGGWSVQRERILRDGGRRTARQLEVVCLVWWHQSTQVNN
jgi:hypothetical protein